MKKEKILEWIDNSIKSLKDEQEYNENSHKEGTFRNWQSKTIIKNYIQCDECNVHLSYNKEDTYISWNWNHKYRILYIDCPKCDNSIAIERID